MAGTERRPRAAWSEEVRTAAETYAVDVTLSANQIRARIGEDLGIEVPEKTVARWVQEVRQRAPVDRRALLSETADRAAVLLRSEVARIERCQPHKRDLNRLDQAVRTLKTLDGIEPGKRSVGARTLSDLSDASESRASSGPSQLSAARAAA